MRPMELCDYILEAYINEINKDNNMKFNETLTKIGYFMTC
jgi:hypothetical protein